MLFKINGKIIKNVRVCPACGSQQVKIYNSREHGGTFRRSRECLACGHRYQTAEIAVDDLKELGSNEALYKSLLNLEKKKAEILEEVGEDA